MIDITKDQDRHNDGVTESDPSDLYLINETESDRWNK